MADDFRWEPDAAAIAHFTSWSGPVGKWTERLARETVFRQRALQAKKTGWMSAGTKFTRGTWSRGIQFEAGSTVQYAAANDQGARPHQIKPKNPGGTLVFYWPKVGRVVHFKSVNHPGNKAYHWAMRGLERALRFTERS